MLLAALAIHQASTAPIIQSRPLLGLSFSVPNNAGEDEFLASLRDQIRLGLDGFYVSVKWGDLETTPGNIDFKKLEDSLGMAKFVGADVALTIQTLDTNQRTLPPDLASASFDSPELLARWQAFLTQAATKLGKRVRWISLGNEVDAYLGAHPNEVAPYIQFLQKGRQVLKQAYPKAQIGVTCMFDGYAKTPEIVEKLQAWTDVVFLTYYPLTPAFGPRPLAEIAADFQKMSRVAAGRKLILQEIGMPAAEIVGSSEQIQADFVSEIFKQLNKHSTQIAFANYFLHYDFQPALLDVFETYYGIKDEKFRGFLGSLGLKKTDGTARKSWARFKQEAAAWFKGS